MATDLAPVPTRARRTAAQHPPALLFWVSSGVVLAGVVMAVLGALNTGVTWDEPYHVMRFDNYLEHGWYALDWAITADGGPASEGTNTVVYAPVTMLLLHSLGVLLGVEGWGSASATPAAYDVRHVGIALIGLVGTAAAAGITRILLRSWRWAVVTAAVLLALPMWTGHLMFNPKDVPVATGYTLVTLALVAMVAPVESRRPLRILCLAAGVVLMVGTRPGMWTAVVVGLAVLAAGTLAAGRFGNARTALAEAAAGVVAAGLILVAVYPNVFAHPRLLLVRSAEQSAQFRGGDEAALGYIPFFVGTQVPLLLLAASLVGLALAVGFGARRWRTATAHSTRFALVGAQLLALPLVAVLKHSDLYNALRQLLFASPAWAVFATLGLARLLLWADDRGRRRVGVALAATALIVPTVDQALLFPYQYTYFNPALDATGIHVPSDYWRTSVPELLRHIPTDGQVVCGPTRTGPEDDAARMTAGRYSSDTSVDCRVDPLGPLAALWAERDLPLSSRLPRDGFYALIDRGHPVPENCDRLGAVERTRHGRDVTMTLLARCTLEPAPLETSVRFRHAADEQNMRPELWRYAPEGWVMRDGSTALVAGDTAASLTFVMPSWCATTTCALELDAGSTGPIEASVDGRPVAIETAPGAVRVPLPRGVTEPWVTFGADGRVPDLRVRSIRVVPDAVPEKE